MVSVHTSRLVSGSKCWFGVLLIDDCLLTIRNSHKVGGGLLL